MQSPLSARLRRIAVWCAALFLGVPLVLVGQVLVVVLVALNVPQGQQLLVEKLPGLTGGMVHLKGLSGALPWHIKMQQLTLADKKGVWLELDEAELRWSPLALLHLGVKVEDLTAARFVFARLPVSDPAPAVPEKKSGPLHLPLSVRLDHLGVARIEIGQEVMGQPLQLSLEGQTRIASIQPFLSGFSLERMPRLSLGLTVHRLDDPTVLALNLTHNRGDFQGRLHYQEGANGFAALLGHMPVLDPLEANLSLSGPLKALQTSLTLNAGTAPQALQARMKGTFDVPGAQGDLALQLKAGPMVLKPGIGWEGIDVAAVLHGPFSHPWGKASVDLAGLAASGAGAEHVTLQFTGQHDLKNPDQSALQLQGAVTGLRLPGKNPTLLARSPLSLQAEFLPLAATQSFKVELTHELLQLGLKGHVKPALTAHLSLFLPDLTPFGRMGGVALQGSDRLEADVSLPAEKTGKTSLKAVDQIALTGGMPQAVALIGPKGLLNVALTRDAAGVIDVEKLGLTGAGMSLQGTALYDPQPTKGQGVKAELHLSLPSFEKAVPALRGGGNLSVKVAGPLDDMTTELGFDGTLGVHTADSVAQTGPFALKAQVQHLPSMPMGEIALSGAIDKSPMALQARFSRDKAGNMGLDLSKLHWKTLDGAGMLALQAGHRIPEGNLEIKITQLAAFRALVGQPLTGQLALAVHTLAEGKTALLDSAQQAKKLGSKKVAPAAQGPVLAARHETAAQAGAANDTLVFSLLGNASLARYGVKQLRLDGKIHHLPDAPEVDVNLLADGIHADAMTGRFQARVVGPQQALALKASGRFAHVLDAPAEFDLSALENVPDKKVQIGSLSLLAKGEHVRLLGPTTVRYGETLGVDQLRLGVAPPHGTFATLTVAGTLKPALNVVFDVSQVTPALAEPFVPKLQAKGVISAHGQLKGTLADPTGSIVLNGTGLAVQTDATAALAPANLQLQANFQQQRAEIAGQLKAGKDIGVQLSGSVPLKAEAPMNVMARGQVNLIAANAVLGVSGMGASGMLSFDLGARGTRAHPLLTGGIQMRNGTFDQYTQGVHLTGITGDVVANNDEIDIKDFLLHAGAGTMDLKGSVGVLKPGIPVALTFVADKAQPIHSDILTATLNANVHINGQAKTRLDVDGKIEIPEASITIPDAMPASVPQIEIVNPSAPNGPPPAPPLVIGLNLGISAPGQIFVRGHGVYAAMGGKLHVGGTSVAPLISGGFTLRNGSFNLAGINLDFTHGQVTFNGAGIGHKLDPMIDFRADRNANGTLASLIVTGYASDPKLEFVSSPPYPKDDVLSMLLFGSLRASLSPAQLAQLGAAVLELGGGISIDPLSAVRNFLGLDQLTIGGGGSVDNGGTAVEAGKYVLPGVFVGAREGLSGSGTQAEVKIDLTKHLTLQTTVGTGGQVNGFTTPENDPGSSVSLSYGLNY